MAPNGLVIDKDVKIVNGNIGLDKMNTENTSVECHFTIDSKMDVQEGTACINIWLAIIQICV